MDMDSSNEEVRIHMDRFEEQQRIFIQTLNQIDDESDEDKELTNNLMQLYSSGQIPRDPDCVFSDENFQGRFCMPTHLVLKIIGELCQVEPQFNYQYNALNIRGHSPEQKVTSALRILGYGRPPDSNDEYLHVREILKQNQERGFPGMLGSLEYMHWVCTGCPTYWSGQYKGHYAKPTVTLEAAASYDCWICHAFFGLPGSQNDINVLHKSPLFEDLKYGISPQVNFSINKNHYTHGYYLVDGIYLKWSTLVQCYCQPPAGEMGPSYSYFNNKQMSLRKDVERAFGILKRKFAIICGPYRGLSAREMHKTTLTCIIMHNMVIQETRRNKNWTNHQDEDLRPEIIPTRGLPARNYVQMTSHIENRTLYNKLREDLRANLWAEFRRDGGRIE
ncbi:uncharacterized protein LOC113360863 [Papaver somniferum]|uniref:uncharacterized protein LOC113360863 n=1 Tax=Papaver somniferum TaxID=3469 RepID=UPI000E6F9ED7|nr:uncharacterized protein LOC113360863 [Papaver somniferum]